MPYYVQLDLQFFAGEKTEKATPKKRQDARKKGQVAKSQDVSAALTLFSIFLVLMFLGGYMKEEMFAMITRTLDEYMFWELSEENIYQMFLDFSIRGLFFVAPIMVTAIVIAVFSNFIQFGFLFSTEPIQFKLEKINPIAGAKRIFSIRALVELLKSILKISVVGSGAFLVLWIHFDEVLVLSQKDIAVSLAFLGKVTIQMGLAVSILLTILSIFDYAYQRYDHEKNLRMSKQDIKDEYKNMEGDPKIKAKIKEKQRQMAMRRMMQEIPNADVVITNPTHYAVVLKYDEDKADAPIVVAKGVDYLALKIKQIAKHHDIITVENRPLARALYEETEIGDVIPEHFFKAVAEILAYVYRLKRKI
ncbi:flagellar biosynthesis protein FlhB [Calidifontibacillus erzurumensis]|uniref:Flagellar biosynthetic protein FlhB n=1 Tax=Calidifontibacillus erzurumensis TaxID=2741433 RepID=A0A8J8GEY0_9BACI|nr:flagellar biosynthesis protein FlhB [Calidifontibacillus erzurumensis]NSL51168.1 flagellar biosynthesis protein FlhB [Calidifontibacillus erzurumensis]